MIFTNKKTFFFSLIYLFNLLFCNRVSSYLAKTKFIVYNKWFDDDLEKNNFYLKNRKITNISKINDFFINNRI